MNAITPTDPDPDHPAFHTLHPDAPAATRHDGWTAERQRSFLTALSVGHTITQACALVDMSTRSAYTLRNAARGAAFRLAWDAAQLHARDALADALMDRAFNGVRDTVTYDDGRTVTRHRHDNVLAFRMLNRLDKRADAACSDANAVAARLAAADFEQLLDLIARDAAPARAGLFLAARLGACGTEATEDDLAPIRTLARADRWLRTHTDLAGAIDTADLDPAGRAHWTAEQWVRAEAAGLVQFAPPEPAPPPERKESAMERENRELRELDAENRAQRVWWCRHTDEWRTNFPPPPGFDGEEEDEPEDEDYSRTLTEEEAEALQMLRDRELAPFIAAGLAERDAWLAVCRGEEEEEGEPAGRDGEESEPVIA